MYSPGAANVAVVVDFPPLPLSISGFGLSNFTAPGPRNMLQVIASGGGGVKPPAPAAPRPRPRPRPRPPAGVSGMLIFGPSSLAHVVNVNGSFTVAEYV